MMIYSEIRFTREHSDDGFGFACMKAAYLFGITGRMYYNHNVIIQAEGEQGKLEEFIAWIKENAKETEHLQYHNSLINSGKYKEFDIFRQSV